MEKCISETIAEALEADLASGRWKTGEQLPSVDELRERFGAGEYAVRRAIRRLADSGAISVKKHVGDGDAAFAAPELACFMTKKANPGFTVIIR